MSQHVIINAVDGYTLYDVAHVMIDINITSNKPVITAKVILCNYFLNKAAIFYFVTLKNNK